MPVLYGQRTGISSPGHELIKAGVSEVIDQGSTVVVLFSAVNAEDHAVELMPPQIHLGGMKKTGKLIRRSRLLIAEELPVTDFRMTSRRLGPGERADGVVVFQRPSFKQSNETLFLQMAESGAVDHELDEDQREDPTLTRRITRQDAADPNAETAPVSSSEQASASGGVFQQ